METVLLCIIFVLIYKLYKYEEALSKQKEVNEYVIGYIHRQNEQELEEANEECKEEQMKVARAVMEKRKEVLRGLDD